MTDNDKSYGWKYSKENREMQEANGEGLLFYKESERTFLARRRLIRDLKEGHVDEMCSYLQSIFMSASLLE